MKIYTKTGDDGTTGLQGGKRVSKFNPRILAYGAVDEINSILGIILSKNVDNDLKKIFIKIQNDLFVMGSDLSNPNLDDKKNRISSELVQYLEEKIDQFENELTPLSNFILPGGHHLASLIHFSRTVTRRAESNLVMLSEKESINQNCQKYLNRLSDLLFVLARLVNKRNGINDTIWGQKKDTL
jgi:cob(I)alamin adenosyltransferase